MQKIAIFASGGGSNAEAIFKYFESHKEIKVQLVLSNRKDAYVLERAENYSINNLSITKDQFYNSSIVQEALTDNAIDYIILAGFLLLIPNYLVQLYPDKVLNIHPALLPKYGGKGMYGHHVHQAVFDNFEKESGMTIHLVNDKYDDGKVLFQAKTTLAPTDTPSRIAEKVLKLEHMHYPEQIEKYIRSQSKR